MLAPAVVGCSDPAGHTPDAPLPDTPATSVTITPASFDFGEHELGEPAPLHTFTITSALPDPVDITNIGTGGAAGADFTVVSNTCPATLSPGQSCDAVVQFTPGAGNARVALLSVATTVETYSAPIQGTGVVLTPKLVFDPPAANLGDLAIGDTSGSFALTVLNEASPASFAASLDGANAASFEILSNDCAPGSGFVPLHDTCSVKVAFHAVHGGAHIANLTLTGPSGAWSAGLMGHSSSPFVVSPFSAAFGSMLVGQPEPGTVETFTVQNATDAVTGTTTGTLTPTLTGPGAADFTIESTDCTMLAPQATCSVVVRLAATTRGTKSPELVVTDGTSSQASHVTLSASAYTVFVTTSPQFAATTAGQTTTKTLTVANPSDRDSGAISLGITGSDFAISTTTCSGSIAAHASCTVDVEFSPTTTGAKSATLTASAAPGGSHNVTLMGTGQ